MNVFPWRLTCSICGGSGVGTTRTMTAEWYGDGITHADPAVCLAVIAERQRRWTREHRFRVYCEGREFGKDYTRTEARAAAERYAASFPVFRYTVRDERGRFA